MKLRKLDIERLPGIGEPFTIDEIGDGVQIFVGPNGIGKSSLCRASRALLWSEEAAGIRISARAGLEQAGSTLIVERDGTLHRWQRDGIECEPPVLPPAHESGCFFLGLRDLLDPDDAGQNVAKAIRRQMSGGFDLDAVRDEKFVAAEKRLTSSKPKGLDEAARALRDASATQEALARRESSLGDLEASKRDAEEAQRRVTAYQNALALRALRERQRRADDEFDALPAVLSKLRGNELERIDGLERELGLKRGQLASSRRDRDAARGRTQEQRLAEPIAPATLEAWRNRADEVSRLDNQIEAGSDRLADAEGRVASAAARLGAFSGERDLEIDLAGAGDLFSLLRSLERADRERQAIDAQLHVLAEHSFSESQQRQLERLRRAQLALRSWLRAPDPDAIHEDRAGEIRRRRPYWVLSILFALVGVAGGALWWQRPDLPIFEQAPSELVLLIGLAVVTAAGAGLALGMAIAAGLRAAIGPEALAREAAAREFPTSLESPPEWSVEEIVERLGEVDDEVGDLTAQRMRARDRDVDAGRLETQKAQLLEGEPERDQARSDLAARLGLDEVPPDAELIDAAMAIQELWGARQEEAGARALVDELVERRQQVLRRLAHELQGIDPTFGSLEGPGAEAIDGEEGGEKEGSLVDAISARQAVTNLDNRSRLLAEAIAQERSADEAIESVLDDIGRVEQQRSSIYALAECEAGNRDQLARLLDDIQRHRELAEERRDHTRDIEQIEQELERANESQLAELTEADLQLQKQDLEMRTRELEELRDQISSIRAEVEQARRGDDLEDALARQSAALTGLRDERDEILHATAGSFLLDAVRNEHDSEQLPKVLERARELFSTFTHHAYELQVAPDDAGSFIAQEVKTGLGRTPEELSDGTRAQLSLAARLAFVKEAEAGEPLPLFLDEALDHSDAARFHAIAASLGRMARDEDRQIFYFTNDPTDAQRFQRALAEEGCPAAQTIDLAEIRKWSASVAGPEDLIVEPLPGVPRPEGESPERYGARLRVPPFDPRREHGEQHLIHVLWDDLELLHRLLSNRIQTAGQWLRLSRSDAGLAREVKRMPAAEGPGAELDDRIALLEAFIRVWRQGRGRPVDRAALEESGHVTDKYLDGVCEVAREIGGDGRRLIAALRSRSDERLKGYRKNAADELETWLLEHLYIDEAPVLDAGEVRAEALGVPAAGELPDRIANDALHRWWSLAGGDEAAGGQTELFET